MRQTLLLLALFLFSLAAQGQTAADSSSGDHKHGLFYLHDHGYGFDESSLGIAPEISFFGDYTLGLGISKGWMSTGCMGGGASAFNLGYAYSPSGKFSVVQANAWGGGMAFIFGFYAGVKGFYLFNQTNSIWGLSPQVGYSMLRLNISYGYNFFFRKELPFNIRHHSLTISGYIPVYRGHQCGNRFPAYRAYE